MTSLQDSGAGTLVQIQQLAELAEQALERYLPAAASAPTRLHEAMRYAVTGGGKRIRPVLVYATGQALEMPVEQLHGPACAVEIIHAYSLIHDDLPAMDNDDLRRGRPTCHKAFDEATAILAGDALQALAFEVLIQDLAEQSRARYGCEMVLMLARATGHLGMAGGQAIDLAAVNQKLGLEELANMHRLKTGALIEASVLLPTVFCEKISDKQKHALQKYARQIGLAFQIQDDILDVVGDTETLGKPQGADHALNKPTYYSLLGLEGARAKLRDVHKAALDALSEFDQPADLLRGIADYIVERSH
ncbi:MAG: polyprenyl synthetase family protein [Gammaproteobacteria bacterium]|nr:polyprenyl synthetase family protein [Gammaproteobacteria bacterium]